MKKLFLIVFGAFILSTSLPAQELVPLTVSIEDDDQPGVYYDQLENTAQINFDVVVNGVKVRRNI